MSRSPLNHHDRRVEYVATPLLLVAVAVLRLGLRPPQQMPLPEAQR